MLALELRGLRKRFGDTTAVDDLDLAVPGGSFFGLVGPNGAGKTTTLSMAVGLLRPDGGTATGALLYWWGGRLAARRLAKRGAELLDLFRLGPQALPAGPRSGPARPAAPPVSGARAAARGLLVTAGMLLIFPQGLVPIGFNLFGVDPQVRVWFAARYLPGNLQVPVAAAFVVAGVLAVWWGTRIGRPGRSLSR